MRLLLLLTAPLSVLIVHSDALVVGVVGSGVGGGAGGSWTARVERWVRAGLQSLQWDLLERCLRASSLPESECRQLAHLPQSAVAVYASEPRSAADKVVAVLPDSWGVSLKPKPRGSYGPQRQQQPFPGAAAHHAVLVLDPSPTENFGHPLFLFYVDTNVTKKRCAHLEGIYLGDECLTLALRSRCQNQLKRWQGGSERIVGNSWRPGGGRGGGRLPERGAGGLCEVHFLPLVVGAGDAGRAQRLHCLDHPEFGPCPQTLPMASPGLPVSSCELNKNTRRCHEQPLATHLSCRLYQTCDHAVLLSGGWQQQTTFRSHLQRLQSFYRMLRNNGFHRDHIKTFFANSGLTPEDLEGVYPATEKTAIRNHVSYVCRKQHCADSLVLYLNSPTRTDGTMLLWDANLNGIADLKERYSVSELLTDLAGCRAARVLLFVDQSYSGVLSKRLRSSQKHLNVVLIQRPPRQSHAHQSHRATPPGSEDGSWSYISPAVCLLDHLGQDAGVTDLLEPWAGLLNVTLAGAPCNVTPPLTEGELRREFQGCQNLPTALWHQNLRRTN